MLVRSLLALSLLSASVAGAQATGTPAAAPAPARTRVLSIQPFQAIALIFAGEYEQAVTPTATVGLGATAWFPDDFSYTSVELKGRLYVNGAPLAGLSAGASVGYTRVAEDVGGTTNSEGGPTAGAMLDYGWLLGRSRALYVGIGVGAKVLFIDVGGFLDDVALRYPTARLSVGRAF